MIMKGRFLLMIFSIQLLALNVWSTTQPTFVAPPTTNLSGGQSHVGHENIKGMVGATFAGEIIKGLPKGKTLTAQELADIVNSPERMVSMINETAEKTAKAKDPKASKEAIEIAPGKYRIYDGHHRSTALTTPQGGFQSAVIDTATDTEQRVKVYRKVVAQCVKSPQKCGFDEKAKQEDIEDALKVHDKSFIQAGVVRPTNPTNKRAEVSQMFSKGDLAFKFPIKVTASCVGETDPDLCAAKTMALKGKMLDWNEELGKVTNPKLLREAASYLNENCSPPKTTNKFVCDDKKKILMDSYNRLASNLKVGNGMKDLDIRAWAGEQFAIGLDSEGFQDYNEFYMAEEMIKNGCEIPAKSGKVALTVKNYRSVIGPFLAQKKGADDEVGKKALAECLVEKVGLQFFEKAKRKGLEKEANQSLAKLLSNYLQLTDKPYDEALKVILRSSPGIKENLCNGSTIASCVNPGTNSTATALKLNNTVNNIQTLLQRPKRYGKSMFTARQLGQPTGKKKSDSSWIRQGH